ncbi:hypothetical protein JXC34_01540 [Candidatus Woesearchaeota archaeon]|nr:hypothetical protein [Candidatus Woesearchaeota archaeon]
MSNKKALNLYFYKKKIKKGFLVLESGRDKWGRPITSDISIEKDGNVMTFVLYEVGCRMRGKMTQIEEFRFRLYRTWSLLVKPYGYDLPNIVRVVARYDEIDNVVLVGRRIYGYDMDIRYTDIPSEVLASFPEEDIDYVTNRLNKADRHLWQRIAERRDGNQLEQIITEGGHDKRLASFRGITAESIAQCDAQKAKPDGLKLYNNVGVNLLHYGNIASLEVDLLGITYDIDTVSGFFGNILNSVTNAVVTASPKFSPSSPSHL